MDYMKNNKILLFALISAFHLNAHAMTGSESLGESAQLAAQLLEKAQSSLKQQSKATLLGRVIN